MSFQHFFPYIPCPLIPGYQFNGPIPIPEKDPDGWIACAERLPPLDMRVEVQEQCGLHPRFFASGFEMTEFGNLRWIKEDGRKRHLVASSNFGDLWREALRKAEENPWISARQEYPPAGRWIEVKIDCMYGVVVRKFRRPVCTFRWEDEDGEITRINLDHQWRYLKEQTTEKKVMNFDQAMKEYAAGKKVRCKAWKSDLFISKGDWRTLCNGIQATDANENWEIFNDERTRVQREIAACEEKLAQLRRSL